MTACAMCGSDFDPARASGCASCPLGAHCSLSCCPVCGYSTVDLRRSKLAAAASRLAGALGQARSKAGHRRGATLADTTPGEQACIDQLDELPVWQRNQLAAYGLAPGRSVDVLQTAPVVIVRIDHTELALECAIARSIQIARPPSGTLQ